MHYDNTRLRLPAIGSRRLKNLSLWFQGKLWREKEEEEYQRAQPCSRADPGYKPAPWCVEKNHEAGYWLQLARDSCHDARLVRDTSHRFVECAATICETCSLY